MIKFLVMTFPVHGHVFPLVPIVKKLIELGHEVVWITGKIFQRDVENAGARFHPLPNEIDPGEKDLHDIYPELKARKGFSQATWYLKHVFLAHSIPQIQAIDEVLEDFPADVLVNAAASVGLHSKAELTGLPSAMISPCPLCLISKDTAPPPVGMLPGNTILAKLRNRFLNVLIHRILLRYVNVYMNTLRKQIGLKPFAGPFMKCVYETPTLRIQLSTQAFEYPRSDEPKPTCYVGPVLLPPEQSYQPPAWWSSLDNSQPVVLVNQGTLAKNLEDLVIPAIEGLKDKNVHVVAVPVEDGQMANCPENVYTEPFIPFGNLLPHVDVMVSNGGFGATQMALAHGIPLVLAGATEDKMEVAARVEWTKAGINLRKKNPSSREIGDAVDQVLSNPAYRNNAKEIQTDFLKHDAPKEAADALVALVTGGTH